MGMWAPVYTRAERVHWGHEGPSCSSLHPSFCPSSLRRSQLSAVLHTWQYAHTQTHLVLFTGWLVFPCMLCTYEHTQIHMVRWKVCLYWIAESWFHPSPNITSPSRQALFNTCSTLYLYYPLLIDRWKPHSHPFCLLYVCVCVCFLHACAVKLHF